MDKGLTTQQAKQRLAAGQGNKITAYAGRTEKEIILANSLTFFNLVFLVLAVWMLLVKSSFLNLTFMIVVILNTTIGCFQEIRAKRAVDKLSLMAAQHLPVIRDGKEISVRSDLLVQGDLVVFSPGDQICADGTVESGELYVNEALISGEEDPICKQPGDELRSGSFVVSGKGQAVLTRVGDHSYAAKLAKEAQKDPRAGKSEMMRSLDKLIHMIGYLLIPVGLILFIGQLQIPDTDLRTATEGTVAALVGMIPEGLYLLTSVALAVAALKLSRRRVLVQDMSCIESLARVDVLCVDKTGTITEPAMDVEQIIPLGTQSPEYLETILTALYGEREPENETAKAIAQLFPGSSGWECTSYISFDAKRKYSGGVFADQGTFLVGAPESIMGDEYSGIAHNVTVWQAKGYRVLLVAAYQGYMRLEALDSRLVIPLALVVLSNRLRPQTQQTFSYFAKQGVAVKVISGDNPITVSQIALRAGIANAHMCIDTRVLETDEEFMDAAEKYTVFGRVTPDKKKKLIAAMQKHHTVGMTGDGVNDVLAMKQSDCSIAMASGAQAANQVAHLVLLNSDFSAMPGIVGEGRRVINNIQRAATLFLVKNIFSLGLALITLFTGLAFPLASFNLTIVSTLTIGIPGFFLALEPNYARVQGKFLSNAILRALPAGLINIGVVLGVQWLANLWQLPVRDVHSISTAVLLTVGLLVLYRVCTPFTKLRKILLAAMATAAVGAFLVLPPLVGYLQITHSRSWLLLLIAPATAIALQFATTWIFKKK